MSYRPFLLVIVLLVALSSFPGVLGNAGPGKFPVDEDNLLNIQVQTAMQSPSPPGYIYEANSVQIGWDFFGVGSPAVSVVPGSAWMSANGGDAGTDRSGYIYLNGTPFTVDNLTFQCNDGPKCPSAGYISARETNSSDWIRLGEYSAVTWAVVQNFTVTSNDTVTAYTWFNFTCSASTSDGNDRCQIPGMWMVGSIFEPTPAGEPTFVTPQTNATGATVAGDVVNYTTTINTTFGVDLSFCWFQHNDSGVFVNSSFQSCNRPFIFDTSFEVTATNLSEVCGFFGANTTDNIGGQSSTVCFTIGDFVPPTFVNTSNNASNVSTVNDWVQWSTILSDDAELSNFTFGYNSSGSFVNDSVVSLGGAGIVELFINKSVDPTPNVYQCGTFYFGDTFGNRNQTTSCFTSSNLVKGNVSVINGLSNVSVSAFTLLLPDQNFTGAAGFAEWVLEPNVNFSLIVDATGFSRINTTVNVSFGSSNESYSLFPDPSSISVIILDESDDQLLQPAPVVLNLLGSVQDFNFSTVTGTMFIGNLSADTYTLVFSSSGFTTRSYFVTLAGNSHADLTARLLNLTAALDKTFTIRNSFNQFVEDATLTVAARVNASFLTVDQKVTDISGNAVFELSESTQYRFTIEAPGFSTRVFELFPTQDSYTITLQVVAPLNFTSVFDVASYVVLPGGSLLNATEQPFSFITSSSQGLIDWFWFNVSTPQGFNATNISGSPSGGTSELLLNLNASDGQMVNGTFILKVSGFDQVRFEQNYFVRGDLTRVNSSLNNIFEEFGGEFSGAMRGLLVTVIAIIAALMFLPFGAPAAGVAGVATIAYFTVVGWIPVWIVGLIVLTGMGVFMVISRGGEP